MPTRLGLPLIVLSTLNLSKFVGGGTLLSNTVNLPFLLKHLSWEAYQFVKEPPPISLHNNHPHF